MNKIILILIILTNSLFSLETIAQQSTLTPPKSTFSKTYPKLAIPLLFVTYGVVGIESDGLQNIDYRLRNHIQKPHLNFRTKADDYLQFSPAAAVFALNAVGVKGENNLFTSSRIYLTSTLLMAGTVYALKQGVGSLRPDGSAYTSFPSGHTATAFAAAEFLHQDVRKYKFSIRLFGLFSGFCNRDTTDV